MLFRSERHLIEVITCGWTTVLITHRLTLARRADHVVVLAGTRVAEFGPPEELLARGGVFARLFESQIAEAPKGVPLP